MELRHSQIWRNGHLRGFSLPNFHYTQLSYITPTLSCIIFDFFIIIT